MLSRLRRPPSSHLSTISAKFWIRFISLAKLKNKDKLSINYYFSNSNSSISSKWTPWCRSLTRFLKVGTRTSSKTKTLSLQTSKTCQSLLSFAALKANTVLLFNTIWRCQNLIPTTDRPGPLWVIVTYSLTTFTKLLTLINTLSTAWMTLETLNCGTESGFCTRNLSLMIMQSVLWSPFWRCRLTFSKKVNFLTNSV